MWDNVVIGIVFGGRYGHAPSKTSKTSARHTVGAVGMTVFKQHPSPSLPEWGWQGGAENGAGLKLSPKMK